MTESVSIPLQITDKKERYELLLPQIKALVAGESDLIANLSNIMAALKFGMNFFWVGIYFVKNDELVLGPFQGPVACVRIKYGKGVCGSCWQKAETIIVPDVDQFPGHIACNSESKSEIVLPVFKNKKVVAVIDVDSHLLSDFDSTDAKYLNEISQLIETIF
jgi:GAF domain-containing protein